MATPSKQDPSKQPTQTKDDDSDLDDLLDDVLDDFNTMSTSESKKPQQQASSAPKEKEPLATQPPPGKAEKESLDDFSMDEDEFAKQLASAMSDWMQEMDNDKETRETFEKIWNSFETEQGKGEGAAAATAAASSNSTGNSSDARPGETKSFQESISQTMNKLKESSKNIDASTPSMEGGDDAFMGEMMRQLESMADSGEFENLLEGMMQQLMSKELLYEPMKHMAENYTSWLEDNKDKISAADYERYQKQHELCKQVVAKYESPEFDDKNEAKAKELMDLMQKMQDLGQPPASMMEEIAPGMKLGEGGMPDMENCNIM
ncbi:Pex19-domain-containing protein [Lichtheimia hyalospora FSU 10163]|nr:Pex19-domain-containing protein [Lichtheimia hyalospora FSU 10163]